jgi:hypothetical protein
MTAPVLCGLALVSLSEAPSLAHLVAAESISFSIVVLSLSTGASGVPVGHPLACILDQS